MDECMKPTHEFVRTISDLLIFLQNKHVGTHWDKSLLETLGNLFPGMMNDISH